jgi:hypothetical protein
MELLHDCTEKDSAGKSGIEYADSSGHIQGFEVRNIT